jgi:hypothetical protein
MLRLIAVGIGRGRRLTARRAVTSFHVRNPRPLLQRVVVHRFTVMTGCHDQHSIGQVVIGQVVIDNACTTLRLPIGRPLCVLTAASRSPAVLGCTRGIGRQMSPDNYVRGRLVIRKETS